MFLLSTKLFITSCTAPALSLLETYVTRPRVYRHIPGIHIPHSGIQTEEHNRSEQQEFEGLESTSSICFHAGNARDKYLI